MEVNKDENGIKKKKKTYKWSYSDPAIPLLGIYAEKL